MTIIDNSVLVGSEEIIQFIKNNYNAVIVLCQGERVVGDITAVTNDDRFVVDVDILTGVVEMYSAKFKEVTMTRIDDGTIEIRII